MDMILHAGQRETQADMALTRTLLYAFLYTGVFINIESTSKSTDMLSDSIEAAS